MGYAKVAELVLATFVQDVEAWCVMFSPVGLVTGLVAVSVTEGGQIRVLEEYWYEGYVSKHAGACVGGVMQEMQSG